MISDSLDEDQMLEQDSLMQIGGDETGAKACLDNTSSEDEDWNGYRPIPKQNTFMETRMYKSHPDPKIENVVFCPADSHPLSYIKTSSTARASMLNKAPTKEMPHYSGQFDDAESE